MARWRDEDDRDFEGSEESEFSDESDLDDDEVDTEPCPFCGEDVYEQAERCPHCGQDIANAGSRSSTPRWVWLTAIVLVAMMIYGMIHWLL